MRLYLGSASLPFWIFVRVETAFTTGNMLADVLFGVEWKILLAKRAPRLIWHAQISLSGYMKHTIIFQYSWISWNIPIVIIQSHPFWRRSSMKRASNRRKIILPWFNQIIRPTKGWNRLKGAQAPLIMQYVSTYIQQDKVVSYCAHLRLLRFQKSDLFRASGLRCPSWTA